MKIHFASLDISLVKTATEKSYVLEHSTSLPSAGGRDEDTFCSTGHIPCQNCH